MLERPIRGRDFESFHESFDRLIDIGSLSLLIKDKKLKKEIFLYAYLSGEARKNAPEKKDLIKKIKQKLSKKLINEVGENLSNK